MKAITKLKLMELMYWLMPIAVLIIVGFVFGMEFSLAVVLGELMAAVIIGIGEAIDEVKKEVGE